MKQSSAIDVIIYVLQAIAQAQLESNAKPALIKQNLKEAGFTDEDITRAFWWLQSLAEQQCWYAKLANRAGTASLRVFSNDELVKLSQEARGFIVGLVQLGILDPKTREIVLVQLMQLEQSEVTLTDTKWVVLLVLLGRLNNDSEELRRYILALS